MTDDAHDDEDDGFWAIAMEGSGTNDQMNHRSWRNEAVFGEGNSHDDDDDSETGNDASTKVISYRIPGVDDVDDCPSVILQLRPLPASDGIWSPIGADAWYASALLASLLLSKIVIPAPPPAAVVHQECNSNTTGKSRSRRVDNDNLLRHQHPFCTILLPSTSSSSSDEGVRSCKTILELGSGAVGLSGFVCALALERHLLRLQSAQAATENAKSNPIHHHQWKVLLTDNDPPVLEQLQKNLDHNRSKLSSTSSSDRKVDVQVAAWHWKDHRPNDGSARLLTPPDDDDEEVVLVIGSELVYTQETADACVHLLLRLLEQYPHLEIWIVQVTDRFGWWETVDPTLLEHNICVDSIPIPAEIHDLATTMIPMGGALDRHAYGAFCIYRKH